MKKIFNDYKLGLGFMRQGNNSLAQTQTMVDYAMSCGVNYFEACTFYLHNQCENLIGTVLKKYPRDSYILCDKMPIHGSSEYELTHLEEFFSMQLQKCNTDYFDVYLLQALDREAIPKLIQYNLIEFFQKKKEEGKIKQFGFSFHDTNEVLLEILHMNPEWDCAQIQLNYYDWYLGVARDLYFTLKERNIPIIVMGPLKGGMITNRLPQKIQQDFHQVFPEANLFELGFKFLKSLSGISMVLTGAEKLEFLQQNIQYFSSATQPLTQRDKQIILTILEEYKKYNSIGCTGCQYCESVCPIGIQTSKLFLYYNEMMSGNDSHRQDYYDIVKSNRGFDNCIKCGKCEHKCPQHLQIRQIFDNQLFTYRL